MITGKGKGLHNGGVGVKFYPEKLDYTSYTVTYRKKVCVCGPVPVPAVSVLGEGCSWACHSRGQGKQILGDRLQMVRQLPDLQCSQIADNILSPWRRLLPARQ